MIEFGNGNLLHAQVDALVNTVNTMGVMGKGVALQFKQAFPANFTAYKRACDIGEVRIGRMFVYDSSRRGPHRYVINFPTKQHWRSKSRLQDIEVGLHDLVRLIHELGVASIAVPALGCGNGGLNWNDVYPLIERALRPTAGPRHRVPAGRGTAGGRHADRHPASGHDGRTSRVGRCPRELRTQRNGTTT